MAERFGCSCFPLDSRVRGDDGAYVRTRRSTQLREGNDGVAPEGKGGDLDGFNANGPIMCGLRAAPRRAGRANGGGETLMLLRSSSPESSPTEGRGYTPSGRVGKRMLYPLRLPEGRGCPPVELVWCVVAKALAC